MLGDIRAIPEIAEALKNEHHLIDHLGGGGKGGHEEHVGGETETENKVVQVEQRTGEHPHGYEGQHPYNEDRFRVFLPLDDIPVSEHKEPTY